MKRNRKVRAKVLFMLVAGLSSAQLCLGMESKSSYFFEKQGIETMYIPTEIELNNFFNESIVPGFIKVVEDVKQDLSAKQIDTTSSNIISEIDNNLKKVVAYKSDFPKIIEESKKYKSFDCRVIFNDLAKTLMKKKIPCFAWCQDPSGKEAGHMSCVCLCKMNNNDIKFVCLDGARSCNDRDKLPKIVLSISEISEYTKSNKEKYKGDIRVLCCNKDIILSELCNNSSPSGWAYQLFLEYKDKKLLELAYNLKPLDKYFVV